MVLDIQLNDEYAWVLLVASVVGFHYMLTGYIAGGGTRGRIFNKAFMQTNFEKDHEEAFLGTGIPLPVGGNPDMGSGRYASKLDYKDWFIFNTA